MKVKISVLSEMAQKIVASKYYSLKEAAKIVDVLLYGELSGKNTQGLQKLFGTEPLQDIKPQYQPKIVKETALSALIDGGCSAGMYVGSLATDKVVEIALQSGFGIVGVNNTFSSFGALGYYARQIAKCDLIGMVAASSPRTVLHTGSIVPAYGTNPIAFGFPTLTNSIVFDMATSAITWYGLVQAQSLGRQIPDNVAVDHDGRITTDPVAAMSGAILPFDRSYKGSGLAMVVELLAGVLTGASYVFDEGDWGTTFLAFSPSLLGDTHEFKRKSSDLVERVKSGKQKPGDNIRIPGYDLEWEIQNRLISGEIEIEDALFKQLQGLCYELTN